MATDTNKPQQMSSVSVSLAVTLFVLNKEARCQGKISSKASDTQAADEGMQRMFGNQVIYFCFSSKLAATYGVKKSLFIHAEGSV